MGDAEKFKQAMLGGKKETPPPPRPKVMAKKAKTPITTSSIIDKIIITLNPLDLLNPDEIRLREILTASRGKLNRNETYQRNNLIKPLLDFLIKIGIIK